MLKSNYDTLILGASLSSILEGISELAKGKKVAILNDDNFVTDDYRNQFISTFELRLLKKIGQHLSLPVLIDLSDSVTAQNNIIFFENQLIELTNCPYVNALELIRKLDFFNHDLYEEISSFSPSLFQELTLIHLDNLVGQKLNQKSQILPYDRASYEKYLKVLNRFFEELRKSINFDSLVFSLQIAFQKQYRFHQSLKNTDSLLLNMILPHFFLKNQYLMNNLLESYKLRGGDVGNVQIENWIDDKNQIKSVILDNLNGVVNLQELKYNDIYVNQLPWYKSGGQDEYGSLNFSINREDIDFRSYTDKRILFQKKSRMGTTYPFWEMNCKKNSCEGRYLYLKSNGDKDSFHYKKALEDLIESFKTILPDKDSNYLENNLHFSNALEVWPKTDAKQIQYSLFQNASTIERQGIMHIGLSDTLTALFSTSSNP